jgi:hypothetical protein
MILEEKNQDVKRLPTPADNFSHKGKQRYAKHHKNQVNKVPGE